MHRLGRSVEYVTNKDKTVRPRSDSASSLQEAVDYAHNREKTECDVFESAIGCTLEKMHGRTNLTRLLRDGKPLKFFVVPEERMKEFAVEANARGLLFVPVKDKTKEDGKIEIAVWAEDAAKVNRVLEKMKLDYVQADTGSKADVVTAISEKVKQQTALTSQTEFVETPAGKVAFEVGEMTASTVEMHIRRKATARHMWRLRSMVWMSAAFLLSVCVSCVPGWSRRHSAVF